MMAAGIGQGRVTDNLKQDIDIIDDALFVPDELSIEMVYRLLDEEGFVSLRLVSHPQTVRWSINSVECCCGRDDGKANRARENYSNDPLR